MAREWLHYLNRDKREIDFHPGSYYTADPAVVARDAAEIARRAEELGIESCTFICGKGLRHAEGPQGRLIRAVKRALQPLVGRRIATLNTVSEGGALCARFSWPSAKQGMAERASATRSRLQEIPSTPTFAGLPKARSMLRRILLDWGVRHDLRDFLGTWGRAALAHELLPGEIAALLARTCERWALLELSDPGVPLDRRKAAASALFRLIDPPSSLWELMQLVDGDEDWVGEFLPEVQRFLLARG